MARDAIAFVDALGLKVIDPLGFSLGGCVAQEVVLIRPYRPYVVRRLILASTGPQGEKICTPSWTVWSASPHSAMRQAALRTSSPCSSSETKGRDFLRRISSRETDRDQPTDLATDLATRNAQLNALSEWGIPDSTLDPPQPAGRHYAANAGRQRR